MKLAQRLQRDWWQPRLTPLTALLWPLSPLYRGLSMLARRHQLKRRQPAQHPPVVVVGNLIVGGAGKTPVVMDLVRQLKSRGFHPGVISRGYGRSGDALAQVEPDTPAAAVGDEPLLIRLRTGVPVWVGRNRAQVAEALTKAHPEVDVIVSDDGLQHHRLNRHAQLIVFDERGLGNGRVLPAGPLREPLPDGLPPRTLVVYNAAHPTTRLPGVTAARALGGAVALEDWWRGAPPTRETLHGLRGRRLLAAAGTASPQRFFSMLQAEGLEVRGLPLPDHHAFDPLPWPSVTPEVIVTEKDAVKLRPEVVRSTRVWVAALDFALPPSLLDTLVPWLHQADATAPAAHRP